MELQVSKTHPALRVKLELQLEGKGAGSGQITVSSVQGRARPQGGGHPGSRRRDLGSRPCWPPTAGRAPSLDCRAGLVVPCRGNHTLMPGCVQPMHRAPCSRSEVTEQTSGSNLAVQFPCNLPTWNESLAVVRKSWNSWGSYFVLINA